MEEEAERDYGEMQQMVSNMADLGEQVVVLNDEEIAVEKEDVQQVEKDIVTPVQAGPALCPLSGFLARITVPLAASVLGTPATPLVHEMEMEAPSVWWSERLAKLHPKGANIVQLAKETVVRRLGSLTEEAHPSGRQREDFLALLDGTGPFSDQEVAAIDDLVLAMNKTKKKKTTGTRLERQMPPGEA